MLGVMRACVSCLPADGSQEAESNGGVIGPLSPTAGVLQFLQAGSGRQQSTDGTSICQFKINDL